MNYSLYRKYRPKTFNQVYGQTHITKTLINELLNNLVVNSYIFSGQKGSGKTSIAKIFAKAINCLNPKDANPCNECKNCIAINNNASLDFIELDAASNNGVDQIRSLTNSCEYAPQELKYKIYIIDEAHMLTNSAWNALLKTIEEPKNQIIFIFATTEYAKIPDTIISRSQRFDFHKIDKSSLTKLILDVCQKEEIQIDDQCVNMIISFSQGSARDCLTILDQISSISNKKINVNLINELFGIVNIDNEIDFINNIINKQTDLVIKQINEFDQVGINFYLLYVNIINDLMDKHIYSLTNNGLYLNHLDANQVLKINETNYLNLINYLIDNLTKIKNCEYVKLMFEYLILNLIDSTSHQSNSLFKHQPETKKPISSSLSEELLKYQTEISPQLEIRSKQISLDDLPSPKSVFKTSNYETNDNNIQTNEPIQIKTDTKDLIKQNQAKFDSFDDTTSSLSFEQQCIIKYQPLVFKIAFNKDKNLCELLNEKLVNVKSSNEISIQPEISSFLNAKKFIIVSPNGALVQMDNLAVCERFNRYSDNSIFLKFYKDNFGFNQKVIALDKASIKKLLDEYKLNKPDKLDDVEINCQKDDLINKIKDIGNKINNKN